jgi:hypothetical protein
LGDSFIGIEGAYMNLVTHHWGFAKFNLANGASTLFIEDGIKPTVQWIYAYMLAGEKDDNCHLKLDDMTITQLVELYDHAVFLQYFSLETHVHNLLRYVLKDVFPNVMEIKYILATVPKLENHLMNVIADGFTQPLTYDYTPYMEYAQQDPDFCYNLYEGVRKNLDRLITRSLEYYNGPHFARYLRWLSRNQASANQLSTMRHPNDGASDSNQQSPSPNDTQTAQPLASLPAASNDNTTQASAPSTDAPKPKSRSAKQRAAKKAKTNALIAATKAAREANLLAASAHTTHQPPYGSTPALPQSSNPRADSMSPTHNNDSAPKQDATRPASDKSLGMAYGGSVVLQLWITGNS